MQISTARGAARQGGVALARLVEVVALGAVFVVAFLARWKVYSSTELGLDGYLSVGLASIPWRDMLDFSTRDVHPPLYYAALKAWLALVGPTVTAARWPSVACGVLTVVVLGRMARTIWGPLAGVLAAALLAAAPAHIFLSATVRDFSLGLLLSLGSTWVALGDLSWANGDRADGKADTRSDARGLAAYALLTALALYTWYFHAVFFLAQLVTCLVIRPRRFPRLLLAGLVGVIASVPWVAYALPPMLAKLANGVTVGGQARSFVPLADFLRSLGPNLVGTVPAALDQATWSLALPVAWVGLALIGAAVGLMKSPSRQARAPFVLSVVGLAFGLTAVYLLRSGWVGSDNPSRYLLICLPFGIIGQVGLLARVRPRASALIAVALCGFALAGVLAFRQARAVPPIAHMSDPTLLYVYQHALPGDALLASDLADVGLYRLYGRGGLPAYQIHFAGSPFLWADVARDAPQVVASLAERYQRVWFVNHAPNNVAESALVDYQLAGAFYLVEQRWEPNTAPVRLYQAGPRPSLRSVAYDFGGQIRLAGIGAATDASGPNTYLRFDWEALRQPAQDYSIFVHVVDKDGQTVAQRDGSPVAGLVRWTQVKPGQRIADYELLKLPDGLADGSYELQVGLYQGDSRLTLPDGQNYVVALTLRRDAGRWVVQTAGS